jgi:thioredoxin reductase (NADPH)
MIQADELLNVPIFACLDEVQLQRIVQTAADLRVSAGEWLVREGQTADFCVLLHGSLSLFKEFGGVQREVRTYEPGEFFGEIPILLGAPAFASLQAKTDSRVVRLDALGLKELIDSAPKCGEIILKTMTQRLSTLADYIRDTPAERVLVVGSQYDTDCRDIRTFLSMNRIPYQWVDREREPERVPTCLSPEISGPSVVIDRSQCLGAHPTVRGVARALGFCVDPQLEEYDVAVIGGGPAGLAAAVYGASEGLKTLLIEKNAAGGQAGTSSRIENYLGFPGGISGDELSARALRQADKFHAEIVLTREVQKIEPLSDGLYCVELDGETRVRAKTVILSTGVDWRRLEAEGVDRLIGKGVLYGAAKTEASTVIGKDIFIVGGGNSAGQAAMYFSDYAKSVTVLVRGAGLHLTMSSYLEAQIAKRNNIHVEVLTNVLSASGDGNLQSICTITQAEAKQGHAPQPRKADALFIMIGADANTGWLPDRLLRDDRGYICTGRDVSELPEWRGGRQPFMLETNLPGVFCAGDVRHNSIKRVSSSVGEGSMAIAFIHQYMALTNPAEAAAV